MVSWVSWCCLLLVATVNVSTAQFDYYDYYDYGAPLLPPVPPPRPRPHHRHRPLPPPRRRRPVPRRPAPPPPPPPPPPPAAPRFVPQAAIEKAHREIEHNLAHGHHPTHGGRTVPHGPHHTRFDAQGRAISKREAEK